MQNDKNKWIPSSSGYRVFFTLEKAIQFLHMHRWSAGIVLVSKNLSTISEAETWCLFRFSQSPIHCRFGHFNASGCLNLSRIFVVDFKGLLGAFTDFSLLRLRARGLPFPCFLLIVPCWINYFKFRLKVDFGIFDNFRNSAVSSETWL